MDILSKEKRSWMMKRIGSKNTKPEMILRSKIHRLGYRFRVHKKDLPGKPDIVFTTQKVAIFVHGCFWHYHTECKEGRIPSSNTVFWKTKLSKNVERDRKHQHQLVNMGWTVIVVWECDIERRIELVLKKVKIALK